MPPLCCASGSHLSLSFPDEVAELQTVKLEGLTAASPCTRQTSDTTGDQGPLVSTLQGLSLAALLAELHAVCDVPIITGVPASLFPQSKSHVSYMPRFSAHCGAY